MPINAHPEYIAAEKLFHQADNDEERLEALDGMVKTAPKHKGGETLRVNLKARYKKLKDKLQKEKVKARSRGKQIGIKKGDMQAVLLGFTNSGKSSIMKSITNAKPNIASYGFTTKHPEQGILNYETCQIQIIDLPPVGSEYFDTGIVNIADTILLVVEKIHEIKELEQILKKAVGKKIIIFNKTDLYDKETQRKIKETLKSKRYNFIMASTKDDRGIEELKEKIFKSFRKIRVYTKQPEQKKHDNEPVILEPGATIKDVAEKILHGFSRNIKKTKIWGPSSKFSGQQIGLKHKVKDKDIVEFTTK